MKRFSGRAAAVCGAAALSAAAVFVSAAVFSLSHGAAREADRLLFGDAGTQTSEYRAPAAPPERDEPSPAAPDFEAIEAAATVGFEEQAARVYLNGRLYPFSVAEADGEYFVEPQEFAAEALGGEAPVFEFPDGEEYCRVSGRCLYCPGRILRDGEEIFLPLSDLSSLFGLSLSVKDGDVFAEGDAAPPAGAEEVYGADDLYWLSRIICCESMSESLEGKIAVGNVVLNRVASPDFPSDVKGVVFDCRYGVVQFSPVAGGYIYREPDPESVDAAKICLEGVSLSDEILYFMNPDLAESTWISDNREAVMTIGHHTFYS